MITTDPRFTIAARDYQNYLLAIDHEDLGDHYRKEVRKRLAKVKKKDGTPKYAPIVNDEVVISDAGLKEFAIYLDSELGGDDRLGNALPAYNPRPKPPAPAQVRNDALQKLREGVTVTPEGTITHTDAAGHELHEAHEYMHEIFDFILYEARKKLETINAKLQDYSEDPDDPAKRAAYETAVKAYNDFRASFPAPGVTPGPGVIVSEFASAFNDVKFKPVVTNEGFTVSLRVQLNWKNPRHSSSTIKVP